MTEHTNPTTTDAPTDNHTTRVITGEVIQSIEPDDIRGYHVPGELMDYAEEQQLHTLNVRTEEPALWYRLAFDTPLIGFVSDVVAMAALMLLNALALGRVGDYLPDSFGPTTETIVTNTPADCGDVVDVELWEKPIVKEADVTVRAARFIEVYTVSQ